MPAAAAKKLPKTRPLAAMVDELFERREKRYALQRQVDAMGKDEKELREAITQALLDTKGTTGISGRVATASLVAKEKLVVEDWDALYRFILKTKSFELLQRRLGEEAAKERFNHGVAVPGVTKAKFNDLSLTKV